MGRRQQEAESTERQHLADELAGLKAEIKALREERSNVTEVAKLRKQVADLEIQKGRLEEDNAKTVREIEHKTGLHRAQVEAERENAKAEAKIAAEQARLDVQKDNLAADKQRFADEMKFQREHMQREVDRFDGIAKALMERLPVIDVKMTGSVGQPAASGNRKAPAARKGTHTGDDLD